MNDLVSLFKSFDKYKDNTTEELKQHIEPSIISNQYQVFQDEDGVYGFVNWAFLNKEVEDSYKLTSKINMYNWKSGDKLWLVDIVISRNPKTVMSWVYNYFKAYLNVNESINWLRLDKEDNIYRVSKKFKREFHNGK